MIGEWFLSNVNIIKNARTSLSSQAIKWWMSVRMPLHLGKLIINTSQLKKITQWSVRAVSTRSNEEELKNLPKGIIKNSSGLENRKSKRL